MYGVFVGKVIWDIFVGGKIIMENLVYVVEVFIMVECLAEWEKLDIFCFEGWIFWGFYWEDGWVGICNFWLVILLVFCEN